MTTFADDRWKREAERFSSFLPVWKTDDENWIATRNEVWRAANQDADEDPWTLAHGNFYTYGEEPPRCFVDETGLEQDIRFGIISRISYTPFASADDLLQFWELLIERNPGGVFHDHGSFRYIGEVLDRFPERDKMVKLVTETMFSPGFFLLYAESNEIPARKRITIHPRDFVTGFSNLSTFYHANNRHEWDYRNFSIQYFLMSVHFCEENDSIITPRQQKAIPKMYEFLLALDDSTLDRYRLELKQKLISAAEAENAPMLLREALESAQNSETLWRFHDGHNQYLLPSRIKPRPKLKKPNLPK